MSKEEYNEIYNKIDLINNQEKLDELNKQYLESNNRYKIGDILCFDSVYKKIVKIVVINESNNLPEFVDFPSINWQTELYDITKATEAELIAIEVRREEYNKSIGFVENK